VHYFVVTEYFMRSGYNQTHDSKVMDQLRKDIQLLTGPHEYAMMYNEPFKTSGSKSKTPNANPLIPLYWIQMALADCGRVHKVPAPILQGFAVQISQLSDQFWEMNKIDKTQFPLPYAQVVKVVLVVFVFLLAFVLQPLCKNLTEIMIAVIAMGFFGLDEVAEIMESPFGTDPNDINLRSYGRDLMLDLEMLYHGRTSQVDTIYSDENEFSFEHVLKGGSFESEMENCIFEKHQSDLGVFSGRLTRMKTFAIDEDVENFSVHRSSSKLSGIVEDEYKYPARRFHRDMDPSQAEQECPHRLPNAVSFADEDHLV